LFQVEPPSISSQGKPNSVILIGGKINGIEADARTALALSLFWS